VLRFLNGSLQWHERGLVNDTKGRDEVGLRREIEAGYGFTVVWRTFGPICTAAGVATSAAGVAQQQ
jgi:hypothetical protein